ncbi:rhodanese-like domain-containing protein [Acidithiobacillus acidisediminis]|uniref:rhodanese-like domain-containing protein n=1 Tax=Acidithiobacillus acidisediminis TaxID=2937799 RepID=UPI00200F5D81|nr:rhodanese-like domain-containing protein [Acidithiobacillus sp. S30A2]
MAKTLADFIREARAEIAEVDCDTVEGWLDAGEEVLIVDVREAEDFHKARLPGAHHVPRGHLEALADRAYGKAHPELSRAQERRVLLYCDSGTRSAFAALTLLQMGFTQVYSLAGGMVVWEAEDKPIIS